jgi:hypothetical protein
MEKEIYTLVATNNNYLPRYGLGTAFVWCLCNKVHGIRCISLVSSGYHCREGLVSGIAERAALGKLPAKYFEFVAARVKEGKIVASQRYSALYADRYERVKEEDRTAFCERAKVVIDKGVRFLNLFEKASGWPLTRVYPVVLSTENKILKEEEERLIRSFYYLRTSSRWIKSPQFISMLILLLRNGVSDNLTEFKSAEEVVEASKAGLVGARSSDRPYLKSTIPIVLPMMRDWKAVFPNQRKENWDKKKFGGYIGIEGMATLLRGQTRDVGLRERFAGFKKKWANEARSIARKKAKTKSKEESDGVSSTLQAGA